MQPRTTGPAALLALAMAAWAAPAGGQEEHAAFLTLLGVDTLAVEWMTFDGDRVDATALVRGSRTTFSRYSFEFGPDGIPVRYEARTWIGGAPEGAPARVERLVREGGEAFLEVEQGGEVRRRPVRLEPASVPFIDMLHWPFEAALRWQARHGGFRDDIHTFTGRGMRFALERRGDGTWSLRHPSRGPSTVRLDEAGRILALDGTGSTRAYDLRRKDRAELDMEELGARFAQRPLGELSGRGTIDATVAGVHFTGDYGVPRKRGRQIFGKLVAYGKVWRTGANAATQISFDRDIVIDGEVIPAGSYSLFTIPEEDGGVLIINRQTGQNGQSYDPSRDQARVRMRRDRLNEVVEAFEIRVVPEGEGGRIELRWDDTVYWVPFTVR